MMMNVDHSVDENWQGKPKSLEKTCPMLLCPQIPHDVTWA
jgi:hypothetical protein